MSCTICPCSGGETLNTGAPNGQRVIKNGVKLWFVPTKADDGTRNQILDTDTLDDTFFTGKFQEEDPSKRWYPVGEFRNVTDERGDPIFETFSDGSRSITQQGLRTYQGWLLEYAAVYQQKLQSLACDPLSVYIVDECGDLVGSYCKDGGGTGIDALRPIQINKDSFDARVIKGSDTLKGKVQLIFDFSQLERDSSLRKILNSEMEDDVTILDYTGLIDMNGVFTNPGTTGFDVALTLNYDNVFVSKPVVGLVAGDFTIFNVTQNSAVTPSGVTEAPEGTYAVVIPAQTNGDILRVTIVNSSFYLQEEVTIP